MTRLLLTLLALFTGLVASGASAEVRVCAINEAASGVLGDSAGEERIAAHDQGVSAPRARRLLPGQRAACAWSQGRKVYLPTVQLGPDRAHE